MDIENINVDSIVDYKVEYGNKLKKVSIRGTEMKGCCPFHDDKNPSFTVNLNTGKWFCHAGCGSGNYIGFVAKLNDIDRKEAYKKILLDHGIDQAETQKKNDYRGFSLSQYCKEKNIPKDFLVDIFHVSDVVIHGTPCVKMPYMKEDGTEYRAKIRQANKKQFYDSGKGGVILYGEWMLPEIREQKCVCIVEGESDTQSMRYMNFPVLGVPGASSFNCEMAKKIKDFKCIYVHCESDDAGNKFAFQCVPERLKEVGYSGDLYIWKCSQADKGLKDPNDLLVKYGKDEATKKILELLRSAEKIDLSCVEPDDGLEMMSMNDIEEKEAEWLIPVYMPKYSIVSLAGDGGSGKTSVWCALAAAISRGDKTFLEKDIPDSFGNNNPQKVMFFSAEDSAEYVLKRRLKNNGANLKNILSIGVADDRFKEIKFNSPFLGELLQKHKPTLCIFDPIQAFVPPTIKMGDRNAMRNCMEPLIGYGEKYGTTFLIIEHTNKQSGIWGRKRIADSADIWDISRSVLIAGETNENGIRYLSHEKSNLGQLGKTILYSIDDDGSIRFEGYTDKRDRDFVTEVDYSSRIAPQKKEAKEFIIDYLKDEKKEVSELDGTAAAMGISKNALKNAKAELNRDGKIKTWSTGFGKDKTYYITLTTLYKPTNK